MDPVDVSWRALWNSGGYYSTLNTVFMRVRFDRRLALGFALGVAAMSASHWVMGHADAGQPLERASFHSAVDTVLERYVEPVDAGEVMARGLKHMVGGLDPYSHYLTASERKSARAKLRDGARAGLTVALRARADVPVLEVLAVDPGSAAEAAGLSAGDFVHELRGRSARELSSVAEAELMLAGRDGETVEIVAQRAADPGPRAIELVLSRPSATALVAGRLIERGDRTLGYIRLRAFRAGTGDAVKQRLAELRRAAGGATLDGIVLDVRGNPGGEVAEAVIVADMFVARGVLTRTRGRGGRILREESAHAAGTDLDTPVVVLQDRHTASAAELLAVALQDHGRARIVGERSYGKGTVQDVIGMPDGSVLTLTIARYFSPLDRTIDGEGVRPDVAERLMGRTEKEILDAAVALLD